MHLQIDDNAFEFQLRGAVDQANKDKSSKNITIKQLNILKIWKQFTPHRATKLSTCLVMIQFMCFVQQGIFISTLKPGKTANLGLKVVTPFCQAILPWSVDP